MEKSKSWKVETPWVKSKGTVTDKSGAKHTPMSRARDLARKALAQKQVEENVVQVNELSKETLTKYKSKAAAQAKMAQYYARYGDPDDTEAREQAGKDYDKRKAGVAAASKKLGEGLDKADVPAYLRKQKGEKLTLADIKAPRKGSISSREALAKARNEELVIDGDELDEARGRPRKNPAPVKAKSDDDEEEHLPDRGPEPDQNIHQQLKRAADTKHEEVKGKEGFKTKGGAHVTFANGEKHFVHAEHAHKVLSALEKLKPADRSKMHDHIYQSHSNFQAVHKLVS